MIKRKITIEGLTEKQVFTISTLIVEYVNFYRGPFLIEGQKGNVTMYFLDDKSGTVAGEIKQAFFLLTSKLTYKDDQEITKNDRDYAKISGPVTKR